jgi:uncharacterized phage protein (TIGR02218 family)
MVAFSFQELSNYLGRATFLATFTRGGQVWTYTSADRDITLGTRIYRAIPMKVGAVNQSDDIQSDEVSIEMPADIPMVSWHILVPPTERVSVSVARYHRGGDDAVTRFSGLVDRVKRVSPLKAEVKCKTLLASFMRGGARLTWQRECGHALYGPGCGVDKAAHAVGGTVTALDGITIVADALSSLADGRFNGGFIEWDFQPAMRARRAITLHSGTIVALLGGTYGLSVGTPFIAYPGCPRNAESCDTLYNNLPNYGGFRHMPSKSPFNGEPVF